MQTVFGFAEAMTMDFGGLQMVGLGHKEQARTLLTRCGAQTIRAACGDREELRTEAGALKRLCTSQQELKGENSGK